MLAPSGDFPLKNDSVAYIVLDVTHVGVVAQPRPGVHTELGRVSTYPSKVYLCTYLLTSEAVGPWGAKLEAVDDTLGIRSAQVHANSDAAAAVDPRTEKYQLKPRTAEGSPAEIILLRHGDVISFSRCPTSLTCRWAASEILVNSSAADAAVAESADVNGVSDTPEEETDDEDLDNTIVAGSLAQKQSPQRQPTPLLSNQRSVVVQETPTAARFVGVEEYPTTHEDEMNPSEAIERTPEAEAEAEPFSTAHTGESQNKIFTKVASSGRESEATLRANTPGGLSPQKSKGSPRVEIPRGQSRKRPSSAVQQEETESLGRPSKRTKDTESSEADTQDSRLSNIVVDITAPKTSTKGKKRLSETSEVSEPRTQRSSQRTVEAYEGPTPRVALSNSAITTTSQAMKFLKKHKGVVVESIGEKCNVLCVRPGTLTKTMKFLQSVALGIPIVTDTWLLDSAKAGHFLSFTNYKPHAPMQEEEWNFQLDKVWGKPQAPFEGYTIHFTPELRKSYADFKEIEQVCKTVGAKVSAKKPSKNDKLIVLAKEDKDKEAEKFMLDGITCYSKDLLTNSILRGQVDLDSDEFVTHPGAAGPAAAGDTAHEPKKKRKRKS